MKTVLVRIGVLLAALIGAIPIAQLSVAPTANLADGTAASLPGLLSWDAYVNFSTNAFWMFRLDPLAQITAAALGHPGDVHTGALLVAAAWGALGSFFFLRRLDGDELVTAGLTVLLWEAVVAFFGLDTVILQSLMWLPWLALGAANMRSGRRALASVGLTLFAGLGVLVSANQISIIILPAGLWLSRWLDGAPLPRWTAPAALLAAAAAILAVPALPLPDYPPFAHVVPDDGLPGMLRPLIGPDSPVPYIDRAVVRDLYSTAALTALGLSLLLALSALRGRRPLATAWGAAALSLLCVLDTAVPEAFTQIAPLSALARTIPELFFVPLAPLALALAFVCLCAALVISDALAPLVALLVALSIARQTSAPQFQLAGAGTPMLELRDLQRADPVAGAAYAAFTISPSYAVIRESDVGVFQETQRSLILDRVPATQMGAEFFASNGDEHALRRLTDRNPASRWSARQGGQHGDEWLCVRFERTEMLHGVEFSPGRFASDFPRGLAISTAAECEAPLAPTSSALTLAAKFPSWQGAVQYTPAGLPYFAGQNDVKVRFGGLAPVRCVCALQIGSSADFDWSVAEVYGLVERGKQP